MESQWVHSHVPVCPSESLAIKLLLPMLNIKKLQGPHTLQCKICIHMKLLPTHKRDFHC